MAQSTQKGTIAIVVFALLLQACASVVPSGLDQLTKATRIAPSDAVAVSISDADATRTDSLVLGFGSTKSVHTGDAWRTVFVGSSGSPRFTILHAELRHDNEVAGFVGRVSYNITGEITLDGRTFPISAKGTRAAAMLIGTATREAIELGVIAAANECRKAIAENAGIAAK